MIPQTVEVVQFVHPGFEYSKPEKFPHGGSPIKRVTRTRAAGAMGWKPGNSRHDRKFMITRGSLYDFRRRQDDPKGQLACWGEWEGPSLFWRIESPGKPFPSIVHAPFRPTAAPRTTMQNTDPLIFGPSFVYSNCLQSDFAVLRNLSEGSLILFGRYSPSRGRAAAFCLDTCFVVEERNLRSPVNPSSYEFGTDLLADVVLGPLYTEGATESVTVYRGRQRSEGPAGPFSFFPARPAQDGSPHLFERPRIAATPAMHDTVSPGKSQGIKVTRNLSIRDRDNIWTEVASQVAAHDCYLGYYAPPPALLDNDAARAIAAGHPRAIGL